MKSIRVGVVLAAFAVSGGAFAQQQGFDPAQLQKQMEALQKAMQGDAKTAQPVVDFRQLKTFLPEKIGDLKRTSAKGEKTGAMGMTISKAEGMYGAEDGPRVKVEITDMAGTGGLAAFAQLGVAAMEIDNESDDGYERTTTFAGFKAIEKYNTPSKSGEVNVVVGRFTVKIDGDGIAPGILKTAVDAIDLKSLSALKAAAK